MFKPSILCNVELCEYEGKLASLNTNLSPCPIDRRVDKISGLKSGSTLISIFFYYHSILQKITKYF